MLGGGDLLFQGLHLQLQALGFPTQIIIGQFSGEQSRQRLGVPAYGDELQRRSAAPLPEVLVSPAHWGCTSPAAMLIEAELAFRLSDTPARPEDVLACIGTVCVSIELIGTRLIDGLSAPAHWKLADQGVHAGLVAGLQAIGTRERDEIARLVSYVPQAHGAFFPYTVREVVLMGRTAHLGLFAAPSARDHGVALDAIRRMGIAHLADAVYTQISGGERQLVLIARALAQQARMVVMDEPTANLDFGNQVRVLERIRALAADGIGHGGSVQLAGGP